VLGTAQNLSTRTLAKGLLWLGVLAAALALALVAGASASAAEPVLTPTGSAGASPELSSESTTTLPTTAELSTSEVVQSTPVSELTPTEPTLVVEVPPVVEPTPIVEVPPPPVAPVVQTPEAPEAETAPKELVPAEAGSKQADEGNADNNQASAATAGETAPPTPPSNSGQIAAALISAPATMPSQDAAVPDGAAVEASSVLLGRLAVGSAGRSSGPPSGPGAGAIVASVPVAGLSAAQRAAELSCQLSGMAGTANDNCGASWLGAQASLSAQAEGFRAPSGSRTGPPDEGYGDSVGGSHPVIPAPAPAPSGAVGGSAAGGSGVSPAGFFSLAGLLLLAAPRALRRLRLLCESWRTAFFVLIPERPG
jgi:hypothetical protein